MSHLENYQDVMREEWTWAGQLRKEGRDEGLAAGEALSIMTVLRTRGLAVSAEQERRITQCQDQALLSRWLVRAISAGQTEDVFQGS